MTRGPALAAALGILAVSSPARAATGAASPADEAAAEALFASGKELMTARRWDEACEKFAASRALSSGIGVTMWLAECHERAGRLASAWLFFRDAEALARRSGDGRSALAESRARALEPRLTRVRVAVRDDQRDLDVLRDGVRLPRAARDTPAPLDPGRYRFAFADAQGVRCAIDVTIAAGASLVEVSPPADCPPAPATSALASPSTVHGTRRPLWAGIALTGLSVAAAGVGTYFGLHAKALDDDARAHCRGNVCTADGVALVDDAFTSATLSTVTFVASAALLTGAVLVFVGVFDQRAPVVRTAAGGFAW